MTNMFKKSLVALALAGASTGAMAADISASTSTLTNEYVSTATTIYSKPISVTLGDEYAADDFIILKFDGDNVVDTTPLETQISVPAQDGSGTTVATGATTKAFTLDYVTKGYDASGDFTWVKFRVTSLDTSAGGTTTVGAVIDFGQVAVTAADLMGSSNFEVSFDARTGYDNYPDAAGDDPDPLDTTDSASLFALYDQFALTATTGFDGTVDVINSYRKYFEEETGTATNTSDTATSTENDDTDAAVFQVVSNDIDSATAGVQTAEREAAITGITYTVSGTNMFGWVEDADANTAGIQLGSSGQLAAEFGTTPTSCTFDSVTADEIMFTCADTTGAATTLEAVLNGNNVVQYGDFEVAAEVSYEVTTGVTAGTETDVIAASPDNAGSTSLAAVDLGAWDVNGSITHIPYMPYSAQTESMQAGLAVDQIIYITNDTTRDYAGVEPAIYVDVLDEDGSTYTLTNEDLDNIKASKGITKITGQVREALFQAGKLNSSKKLSLTVVVEENPDNIEVYSAYNVGGDDRGWVQNDSQRVYND